jgi:hypothetical protein
MNTDEKVKNGTASRQNVTCIMAGRGWWVSTVPVRILRAQGWPMELKLTVEERDLLLQILEEHHRDLLWEIAHTDHHHFKHVLKSKERVLESLQEKLVGELTPR